MSTFFIIAAIIAILLTIASLAIGVVSMAKGDDFRKKYANTLMKVRVVSQSAAIGFLFLALANAG